ncbi:hypothetical protein TERTU_4713 [Teredinibacter turnerae T7901]|uniref:Uncharacterized protein n=1 Tax=Teredinibacter turnerae (strain ATCC 39867 / T7901) TaxID=377629 RepID=C5BKJ2_TERTT|nr:hypothetical protein [Teredinibacter turnerae]ACR11750.1 hypothetical protein TERTU_4713 [Teredinibacter turnerae T7901]
MLSTYFARQVTTLILFSTLFLTYQVAAADKPATHAQAAQNTPSAENLVIGQLLLSNDPGEVAFAGELMEFAEQIDQRISDVAAAVLYQHYEHTLPQWFNMTYALARGIGSTHNARYLPFLQNVLQNSELRHLKNLSKHAIARIKGDTRVLGTTLSPESIDLADIHHWLKAQRQTAPGAALESVAVGDDLEAVFAKLGSPATLGLYDHFLTKTDLAKQRYKELFLNYPYLGEVRLSRANPESPLRVHKVVEAFHIPEGQRITTQSGTDYETVVAYFAAQMASGVYLTQRDAYKQLQWSGLTDARIYDPLQQEIEKRLPAMNDKQDVDEVAWLIKFLAISGNYRYLTFMQTIANDTRNDKILQHTRIGIANLHVYVTWNKVLNRNLQLAPAGQLQALRVYNMLSGPYLPLQANGAKKLVQENIVNPQITELAFSLLNQYGMTADNRDQVNLTIWLARYLVAHGGEEGIALVKQLKESSVSKKVRKSV